MTTIIPPMTHRLSSGWDQPPVEDIWFLDDLAVMAPRGAVVPVEELGIVGAHVCFFPGPGHAVFRAQVGGVLRFSHAVGGDAVDPRGRHLKLLALPHQRCHARGVGEPPAVALHEQHLVRINADNGSVGPPAPPSPAAFAATEPAPAGPARVLGVGGIRAGVGDRVHHVIRAHEIRVQGGVAAAPLRGIHAVHLGV